MEMKRTLKVDVDFTSPEMFLVMAVKGGGGGEKVNGQCPLKKDGNRLTTAPKEAQEDCLVKTPTINKRW